MYVLVFVRRTTPLTWDQRLNYAGSPWMQQAGLQVERQPLEIAARELAAPTVIYGSSDAVRQIHVFELDLTHMANSGSRLVRGMSRGKCSTARL